MKPIENHEAAVDDGERLARLFVQEPVTCRSSARQTADQPSSTGRITPLMLLAASEARNTMAAACS